MKKTFTSLTILLFIITACAPQAPTKPPSPIVKQPTPTLVRGDLTWEQSILVSQLSQTLGMSPDDITVAVTEAVTWPDGCMGIVRMGVMCTQAEVPGFRFILEADGKQYEFHTNRDMSVILPVESSRADATAEAAVINQLALNLGLNEGDISVVSDTVIEFGDSCIGVAMDEMMCAQVVTPGHIIILEADGIQYEYHTNEDGSRIQPASFAMIWNRVGGIAGFCDNLTIFLSGEVYGNQCKSGDGRMETFASLLTASDLSQFNAWIENYGQVTLDASDPKGVADGMTRVIKLFGNGNGKPGQLVEDEIFIWAQDLYQELYR